MTTSLRSRSQSIRGLSVKAQASSILAVALFASRESRATDEPTPPSSPADPAPAEPEAPSGAASVNTPVTAASAAPAAPPQVAPVPVAYAPVPLLPVPYPYVLVPVAVSQPEDTTRRALNAVYLEMGGNGIFYSVNYERFITEDIAARIGVGYLSFGESSYNGSSVSFTSVPLMVNYLGVGKLNHRLELGGGLVIVHLSARASDGVATAFGEGSFIGGTASIAYRYVPLDGGFNFKVAFTPLLSAVVTVPTLGLSFGTAF